MAKLTIKYVVRIQARVRAATILAYKRYVIRAVSTIQAAIRESSRPTLSAHTYMHTRACTCTYMYMYVPGRPSHSRSHVFGLAPCIYVSHQASHVSSLVNHPLTTAIHVSLV